MDVIIQILYCKYQTCLILSGQFWWVSEQFRRLKTGSVNPSHYQIICAKQHCTHWMLIWKCLSEEHSPPSKRHNNRNNTSKRVVHVRKAALNMWNRNYLSPSFLHFTPKGTTMVLTVMAWSLSFSRSASSMKSYKTHRVHDSESSRAGSERERQNRNSISIKIKSSTSVTEVYIF